MARGQPTAKHLDDPLRPFAGLTVGQLLALLAGGAAGFGFYKLLVLFPTRNGALGELYAFLVIAAVVTVAGPVMLLTGGQGEPFGANLLGYLRRRHRYLPCPVRGQNGSLGDRDPRKIRTWVHGRRAADSTRLLPLPASRQSPSLMGMRVDDDGVVTLPGGDLRLYLAVEPVNFDCCSQMDRDLFADLWGSLASALPPGQHLQVLIESRPLLAAPILDKIRRDLRPQSPQLRNFVEESTAWWARNLVRSHVPDHRFTLVLSPGPARIKTLGRVVRTPERDRAAARRSLDDLARTIDHTLKRRRMGCRRLRAEEALSLLWDSLHPSGTPCPQLGDLMVLADDVDRPKAPAARPHRRMRFMGFGALTVGLGALIAIYAGQSALSRTPSATGYPGIKHVAPPRMPPGGVSIGARALVRTSPVMGRFYPSDNRCGFDTPAATIPAFRQTFPTINFGGRPFTDDATQPGGQNRVASGAGMQAGLGRLSHFNASFTGTFWVPRPESIPFTLVVDDAFDFGVGGGAVRVRGALSQPPAGGRTILERLPVVGAFHQGHLQATTNVTVRFPRAGSYPFELDYAECDLGGESLQVSTGGHLLPTA